MDDDPVLAALRKQSQAFKDVVRGLANSGRLDEYLFGLHQGILIDLLDRPHTLPRRDLLNAHFEFLEILVAVAHRDNLPISFEFHAILRECAAEGITIPSATDLKAVRPLKSFPNEAPVVESVYVDEAGTPSFEEVSQPVLTLVGVLASDERIKVFDVAAENLLRRFGLPPETEIHAHECIRGLGPFAVLSDAAVRYALLRDFISMGMSHVRGVHYMSMLKAMVAPDFRRKLKTLNLDGYTSLVIWFNVTLQVARLNAIALAKYRYYFDQNDRYRKSIRRILRALKEEENTGMKVWSIHGDPIEVKSQDYRFVQLSDAVGYFLARYRQFEIPKFRPQANLMKYEPNIREIYSIVQPKVLDYVKDGLFRLVDWNSLQEWSPGRGAKPPKRKRR